MQRVASVIESSRQAGTRRDEYKFKEPYQSVIQFNKLNVRIRTNLKSNQNSDNRIQHNRRLTFCENHMKLSTHIQV